MKTRWTASTALAMLVFYIVSVALLIMAYGLKQDWMRDREAIQAKALNLAKTCAERQKTFTTNTDILLRTLVTTPVIRQGNTAKATEFLKNLDVKQPDFLGFFLFLPDGSKVVSTVNGEEVVIPDPQIIRSRDYFQLALNKKGFNIGEYRPAPTDASIPTLTMSMPVEDSKGNITAVMMAPLDFRRYDTLIVNIFGKTEDGVQIFDRNRTLMYTYQVQNAEMQGSTVQSPQILALMNNSESVLSKEFVRPDGIRTMTAMVKLAQPDENPYMYVYVTVPLSSPWHFITTHYLLEMAGMLAAMLLGLACAVYVGKSYFSRGLEQLALVAASVQSGNYAVRVGPISGCREIQILAEAFDTMLDTLEGSTDQLRYQRACLDFALDGGQMGTWEWDPQSDFCVMDKRGLHLLGYEHINTDVRSLIHPDDSDLSRANMALHLEGIQPYYSTELRLKHHDGHWSWASMQGRLGSTGLNDSHPRVFGIFMDITQRKRVEELEQEKAAHYRRLSNIDPLTGLSNRRHFMEQALSILQQASRYGHTVALAMADIDFFKKVNDTYGHTAGDALLKVFGAILSQFMRQSDIVGRYGGEEFIFLLPETSLDEAFATMEKLRGKIETNPVSVEGQDIAFTSSFGLCIFKPIPGEHASADDLQKTLESLIKCADSCLYQAKKEGRNRVITSRA